MSHWILIIYFIGFVPTGAGGPGFIPTGLSVNFQSQKSCELAGQRISAEFGKEHYSSSEGYSEVHWICAEDKK